MPETYPTFRSGQRVTGNLLKSSQPVTVRKVSDTARTSTTATADPELQFAVEADAVYLMEGILYASSNEPSDANDPSDNIKIDWGAPSGSDGSWGAIGLRAADGDGIPPVDSDTDEVRLIGTSTVTNSRNYGADNGGSGATSPVQVQGVLITGAAAGTYSVNWGVGQNISTAATITLYAHSYIVLQRIA
jgi:hypothetical protein